MYEPKYCILFHAYKGSVKCLAQCGWAMVSFKYHCALLGLRVKPGITSTKIYDGEYLSCTTGWLEVTGGLYPQWQLETGQSSQSWHSAIAMTLANRTTALWRVAYLSTGKSSFQTIVTSNRFKNASLIACSLTVMAASDCRWWIRTGM